MQLSLPNRVSSVSASASMPVVEKRRSLMESEYPCPPEEVVNRLMSENPNIGKTLVSCTCGDELNPCCLEVDDHLDCQ